MTSPEIETALVNASDEETSALVSEFVRQKPKWVTGSISCADACFLFRSACEAEFTEPAEIGTASGFSTAILCLAAARCARLKGAPLDYCVRSYDVSERFYADPTRSVGAAAREMLSEERARRIIWRNPCSAVHILQDYPASSLPFIFIDANHSHPWPILDLLVTLDTLGPRAAVVVHDINLPMIHPQFQDWGAKVLFDGVTILKDTSVDHPLPNIGRMIIPDDREQFRRQLIELLGARAWDPSVPHEVLWQALANRRGRAS